MTALLTYTASVMQAIELVSQGYTVTRACRSANISYGTFKRYVQNAPEFREAFNAAEQEGMDTIADLLLEMDDPGSVYGSSDPQRMKVMSDNLKWFLARKRPQQYGDRMVVEHNISADRAIIEALAAGKDRAEGRIIEHAVTEVIRHAVNDELALLRATMPDDMQQFL